MKERIKSLSTKIVFLLAVISMLLVLAFFIIFEKINREAFYKTEMEKASLVTSTIEPLIALNIFLGMENRIEQTVSQLMENPNILVVKVLQSGKIIYEKKSEQYNIDIEDSFVVAKDLYQPNSTTKTGSLVLVYSNKNYNNLVEKYTTLLIQLLIGLALFFLIFSLYVKRLLSPLRTIANLLKNYSPDNNVELPVVNQNNEIGLISKSLNEMQHSIWRYAKRQKNINDYLEEKVNEKTRELRRQLYTNSLTGLPNRITLLKDIGVFTDGALLIIDIDDFKEVNDFFGQVAGNNILISLARKLESLFSDDNNIKPIHMGGDEFALFFMKKPSSDELIEKANTIITDIEKMVFLHENNELNIRVTIGAVCQIQEALEKADIALKSAKKKGKSFLLYDENLNIEKQYKNNIEWVKKINNAIENDKITPYFQAIFDNATNHIVSCECLIRLIDNDTIISPASFLTIAKKSKLYPRLTKIMIEKSCQYFEHLDCDFSVNLSVEDMMDEDVASFIKNTVSKYRVAKKIIFEIIETEDIETFQEVLNFINEMKALGCRIAIDDFGSGYSNFAYLLKLNIDYIKIDGSLIKDLDKDLNAKVVVETIVSFANKLGLLVVAEYVHNDAIYNKVKDLGIDRSQGFYLAEPQAQITL